MEIKVCVGSACHLKGSYKVVNKLKKLLNFHNLEKEVVLKSSFCLGNCQGDVSVSIDGKVINVNMKNIDKIFKNYVLGETDG